jgi:hypothetical protein
VRQVRSRSKAGQKQVLRFAQDDNQNSRFFASLRMTIKRELLFCGGGFGGCFFGMEVVEDGLGLLAVDDSGECFSVGVAHGF